MNPSCAAPLDCAGGDDVTPVPPTRCTGLHFLDWFAGLHLVSRAGSFIKNRTFVLRTGIFTEMNSKLLWKGPSP
jgi:hypothetical protein